MKFNLRLQACYFLKLEYKITKMPESKRCRTIQERKGPGMQYADILISFITSAGKTGALAEGQVFSGDSFLYDDGARQPIG